jgi:hypothetical protein
MVVRMATMAVANHPPVPPRPPGGLRRRIASHALALLAVAPCVRAPAETPAAVPAAAPAPAESPAAPAHGDPVDGEGDVPEAAAGADGAGRVRVQMQLGGNTIVPAGGMSQPDGWSLVELTLADGGPLRVDVRLAPDLAVDPSALWAELIAEANRGGGARQVVVRAMDEDQLVASATLPRATLTLAGRAVDASGGRLSIGGVDLGPLAAGAQVELSAAGVRVDGERRGDLPD